MAMLALAIGGDTISNQARRDAIIDGLYDLPSKFLLIVRCSQVLLNPINSCPVFVQVICKKKV